MSEIGKKFRDINSYNNDMKKSMEDKLYFLDHLPDNRSFTFVDFGCADGSMTNELCNIFRGIGLQVNIGYDCSSEMIRLAKSKFYGHMDDCVMFTNSWNEVMEKVELYRQITTSVLVLSSVIHEVYSYAKDDSEITEFWDRVLNSGFNYIVIRDMMLDKDVDQIFSSMHDRTQILNNLRVKKQYEEFKEKWGSFVNEKNLIHFLLKYRWKVNWERELNENYFPINTSELYDKIMSSEKYNLEYWERFQVPFLSDCFKNDFDITIEENTHIKAIFKKK